MMVDVLPIGEVKDQAKKIPGILKKGAKKLGRLLPLRPKEKVEEKKNGEVPNVVPNDEEIEMMVDVLPIGEVKDQAKKIPGILKKGAKKLGRLLPLRPKEKVEEKKNDEVPNDEEIEMLVVDGPIDGAQSVAKKIAGGLKKGAKKLGRLLRPKMMVVDGRPIDDAQSVAKKIAGG